MADSVTDEAQKQAVTKLNLKMRASHMDECNDERHSSASSVKGFFPKEEKLE